MGRSLVAVKMINGKGYDPLTQAGSNRPYIAFSKVDCTKENVILDYANLYGLPFNPNRVYPFIENRTKASNRAAEKRVVHGLNFLNLGELSRPYETDLDGFACQEMDIDLYRKSATNAERACVYLLDDFWYEVDQMRHILELQGVVEGSLPNSERAPGPALSAEYLKTAINREIPGVKVSTYVRFQENDVLGNYPKISLQYLPIDFKQALYSLLIDDFDAGVQVGRCDYHKCRNFFIVERRGKKFCSGECRNRSNRMNSYHRMKEV